MPGLDALIIFVSSTEKNGRTLALLKSGSKQSTGERKRKKYTLLGDYNTYKESKR